MSYIKEFHHGYTESSCVEEEGICDSCKRHTTIQELPAASEAGELYSVDLCRKCLIELAEELPE